MTLVAMNTETVNARETALRAQVEAARADSAAARRVVGQLVREVGKARMRVHRLEVGLAAIGQHARRAAARTRDECARDSFGSIAVTANESLDV